MDPCAFVCVTGLKYGWCNVTMFMMSTLGTDLEPLARTVATVLEAGPRRCRARVPVEQLLPEGCSSCEPFAMTSGICQPLASYCCDSPSATLAEVRDLLNRRGAPSHSESLQSSLLPSAERENFPRSRCLATPALRATYAGR